MCPKLVSPRMGVTWSILIGLLLDFLRTEVVTVGICSNVMHELVGGCRCFSKWRHTSNSGGITSWLLGIWLVGWCSTGCEFCSWCIKICPSGVWVNLNLGRRFLQSTPVVSNRCRFHSLEWEGGPRGVNQPSQPGLDDCSCNKHQKGDEYHTPRLLVGTIHGLSAMLDVVRSSLNPSFSESNWGYLGIVSATVYNAQQNSVLLDP